MRENVALNDFGDRVAVREQAVAGAAGRAEFLIVGEPTWSHLAERGHRPQTVDTVEVDVVVLDDLVASGELPAPDVVKLNIEGYEEVDALRGMRNVLSEHRPALVIELHETNADVLELLGEAGYRAENLDSAEPIATAGPVHLLARYAA